MDMKITDGRTKQDLLEDLVHLEDKLSALKDERDFYLYLLDEIAHGWNLSVLDRLEHRTLSHYRISSYYDGEVLKRLISIYRRRIFGGDPAKEV